MHKTAPKLTPKKPSPPEMSPKPSERALPFKEWAERVGQEIVANLNKRTADK